MATNPNEIQLSDEQLRQALQKALDNGEMELADSIANDILARETRGRLPQQAGGRQIDTSPVPLPPQQTRRDLGAERPPFFDPSGPQFERTDDRGYGKEERSMAARGIDVTQELNEPDIRAALGFSPNQAFSADYLARALSEKTGLPRDQVVRMDTSGRLVAIQGDRWVPLDSSSLTMSDLRDLYGPATTMGPAVAGGVLGASVGPLAGPWTSVGGGAAGAAVGEFLRLHTGRRMGVHDLSVEDMISQAAKMGGQDAMFGAGGVGFTRLSQFLRNVVSPTALEHGDFSEETAQKILEGLNRGDFQDDILYINRMLADSGSVNRLSIDPVTLAQDTLGLELRDSARKGSRQLRATHSLRVAENDAALDDFAKVLMGLDLEATPFMPGAGRSQLTREAQAELRKEANRIQNVADVNTRLAEIEARRGLAHYGRLDINKAGQATGDIVSAHGNALKSAREEAYEAYSRHIGQPVYGDAGFSQANALTSRIKVPVTQDYVDYAKAQKTIKQASLLTGAVTGEDALKVIPLGKEVDLALLDNNIKWLNNVIDRGGNEFPVQRLMQARSVLIDMRDSFLRENDETAYALLKQAQTSHGAYKDFTKHGVLASIIKYGDDGVVVPSNAKAFHHIWARDNTQALHELMDVAAEYPGARAQLQKIALQIYKAETIPAGSNIPNKKLHDQFVKEYRPQLEAVFGSRSRVFRFGELADIAQKEAEKADLLRAQLAKSPLARFSSKEPGLAGNVGANTAGISPELMGRRVLQDTTSVDDVLDVVRVLETRPEMLKAFQDSVGRQFYEQLMPGGQINMKAIPKLLQKSGNLEKLTHVFGEQYVSDMGKLWRGVLLNMSEFNGPAVEKATPFGMFARAVITPPLTQRGRAQTLVEMLRAKAISEALYQATTNPNILHALVRRGNTDLRRQSVVNIFAQMGISAKMLGIDDNDIWSSLEDQEAELARQESERIRRLAQ